MVKCMVDKQEGMGGTSGHFTAFSTGICKRIGSEVTTLTGGFYSEWRCSLIPTWALRWTRCSTSFLTRWRCSLMSLKCWMVSYVPMPPCCCCAEPICFSDSWKEFLPWQSRLFDERKCHDCHLTLRRTSFTAIISGFMRADSMRTNHFRATPSKYFCHKLTCGWKKKKIILGPRSVVSLYLQRSKLSQINLLIPIHQGLHSLKVWYKKWNYHLIKEVMIAKLIPYEKKTCSYNNRLQERGGFKEEGRRGRNLEGRMVKWRLNDFKLDYLEINNLLTAHAVALLFFFLWVRFC